MHTKSIPNFTKPAAKLWAAIPADAKKKILTNVWCGKCQHAVTIINFSCEVKAVDLFLVGKCAICQCDVARLIEQD